MALAPELGVLSGFHYRNMDKNVYILCRLHPFWNFCGAEYLHCQKMGAAHPCVSGSRSSASGVPFGCRFSRRPRRPGLDGGGLGVVVGHGPGRRRLLDDLPEVFPWHPLRHRGPDFRQRHRVLSIRFADVRSYFGVVFHRVDYHLDRCRAFLLPGSGRRRDRKPVDHFSTGQNAFRQCWSGCFFWGSPPPTGSSSTNLLYSRSGVAYGASYSDVHAQIPAYWTMAGPVPRRCRGAVSHAQDAKMEMGAGSSSASISWSLFGFSSLYPAHHRTICRETQ